MGGTQDKLRDRDQYGRGSGSGKACCLLIIIAVIIVGIVALVLFLTVFRVRDPEVTVQSFQLMSFSLTFLNSGPQLSFVLDVVVAVKNRNHASFKYQASTAYVNYHNSQVGSALVPAGDVKAESTSTISTQLSVSSVNFVGNPYLAGDVQSGTIPFVVQTTLQGKVDVAGIAKHSATVVSTCNTNIIVQTQSVGGFSCDNQFHL